MNDTHLMMNANPLVTFLQKPAVDFTKADIIRYAEANGIVYVDYHAALTDEQNAFQKSLSEDGYHPNPDTYFIMERLVLEAIEKAVK